MDFQTELDLGNKCFNNKEYKQAITHYDACLSTYPDSTALLHIKAVSLMQLGMSKEAMPLLKICCDRNYKDSWLPYGAVSRELGNYQESLVAFANLFLVNPESAEAYSNYGYVLNEFGKPNIAIYFLQLAEKLNPKDIQTRMNLCMAFLSAGEWLNAWEYYDARWYYNSDTCFKPNLAGAEYDGTQDIQGRTVFVYAEQGLGDGVQFARYLNLLQERGAYVTFYCRQPLQRFIKFNYPHIRSLADDEIIPPYHHHVPLMELPKCFNTTVETIPPVNYSISHDSISFWKNRLGPTTKKRVGIVWKSNNANYINKYKSIDLRTFLKLKHDSVEWISLEYDCSIEETNLLQEHGVVSYGKDLGDFYSVAGLMKNLDLIISIDTATVHLAASLGIPTWTLLPGYGCDWRWLTNRNDSPFYPTMRLFRNRISATWDELIETVQQELDAFVGSVSH